MNKKEIYRSIVKIIITNKISNDKDLVKIKKWACKKYNLKNFPPNYKLLEVATKNEKEKITTLLRVKPIRSVSGVSIITVMPKPFPCPKDEPCIYCPSGPNCGTPQSYTGKEPAGRRAIENNFDPYLQVKSRIDQFHRMGHNVDKVELIIFGGTLTAYPNDYLEGFVTNCLNAMSGFNTTTTEDAQNAAENALIRNSDITIETRPDYLKKSHIDFLLKLGVTRIELGVQTVFNNIYKLNNREHTTSDVISATRLAKDSGFAVIYHMMPGLPGSNIKNTI